MSHVMHKEKIKKEMRGLLEAYHRNPNMTNNQIDQYLDVILYHMFRFVSMKMQKSGLLEGDDIPSHQDLSKQDSSKHGSQQQGNMKQQPFKDLNDIF